MNPCSVPPWVRCLAGEESEAQQLACARHDEAYERGGSEHERAIADALFLYRLLAAEMDVYRAEAYWRAVREWGGTHWGTPQTTWTWPQRPQPVEAP